MLHQSDFRNIFIGRSISNAGDSVYGIALGWYFIQFKAGTILLGILEFVVLLPSLFLFVFGRYIDRYAKKTILIVCEIGQALCVSGVAVAIVIFRQNPGVILGLSFLSAMFGVNSYPTQDALLPQIVSQKELPQAASYMAFAYNGVSYFFNALTGFILHVFSVLSLVVTDVLTFLVSACFFGRLKHNQADTTTAKTEAKTGRTDWSTGFKVILRRPSLVILMAPIVLIANHYIFVAYYGLVFVALGVEQTAQAPIMQSMLSKDLLGRVMGAYYTFTLFAMGLGGLLFGLIGGSLSPKIFLLIFSGAMLVTGLAFAANSELRKYAIREE